MSFSAVLALISGYEVLRPALHPLRGDGAWRRRFASHLAALALTSALAGTASAPFGAYHFGRIQVYFVVANMVAVPLTALWVMPAGLIVAAADAVRARFLALRADGLGRRGDPVGGAHHRRLAGRDAGRAAYAGLGVGGDRVRHRLARAVAEQAAADRRAGDRARLASPLLVRPPDLLVSEDARLIGVRVPSGVYLQHETPVRRSSREMPGCNTGRRAPRAPIPADGAPMDGAITCRGRGVPAAPVPKCEGGDAGARRDASGRLREASVIVSAEPARGLCPRPWPSLVDRFTVWRYGAVAIWLDPGGARRADRSCLARVTAVGAAAAFATCPRCTGAPRGTTGQLTATPGLPTISVKDMSARDIV